MNPQQPSLLNQYGYNLPNTSLNDVASSANQASQYQQASDLLPAQLKQAIEEKLNYNQDLIKQKNDAQANYLSAPATARNQYQNIANPFEREQLVSQATNNALSQYSTLNDILAQRQGSISDIVNQGTGAFNAQTTAAQNAANLVMQLYQLTHPSGGGIGSAQYNLEQSKAAGQDASKGMTLQDLLKKYTGQLDPNTIYSIYNQYNYGPNPTDPNARFNPTGGGYGAPKQDASTLSALGITGAPVSASAKKSDAISNITDDISQAKNDSKYDKPGFLGIGKVKDTNKIFTDLRNAYPELSDSEIKTLMRAQGLSIN